MKRLIFILTILCFVGLSDYSYAQLRLEGIKREALKHMQKGRYGDAIDQLNKFIAASPRNPEGYYLRGLCFEKRQEYFKGRVDYRKAIKLDNGYKEARIALERLKNTWYPILYDKIEGHKRDIAVNPDNPYYYLEIGKAYRNLEEWEKAEEWYDKYLARDPNASPDEIIRYTIILTETRHIYKGWLKLKEYTERYPDDWRLWSRFGWFSNWLGKYKIAEKAFLNALKFKPFFKEAQDGLDVARREAYVTLYTEDENGNDNYRKGPGEYPIDKYYRIIKNNPDDDESRFKLVELLIEHDRYEEAFQQLNILSEKYYDDERFKNLWDTVSAYRKRFYEEKISDALSVLSDDPDNKEATLNIANYYASLSAYQEAESILRKYLDKHPDEDDIRYRYAKILSEDGRFDEALEECDTLLSVENPMLDYKLLAAQLNIWSNKDLDLAENLLNEVLEKRPDDIIAIIAMGTLKFQKDDLNSAEEFAKRAEEINPDNKDLHDLQALIELEKIRQEEHNAIEELNKGRDLAAEGNCMDAIPYYLQYLEKYPENDQLRIELANVYECAGDYNEALSLYDEVLDKAYDLDLDKQRAKIYFWSGDSMKAYEELSRLVQEDPDDMEMQLYYGDVNLKLHNFDEAKKTYLALKDKAPDSYIINQRLEWLPPEYQDRGVFSILADYLFSYMNLNPAASYFNDNLGFEHYFGGADLNVGFTQYAALGGTFYRGLINNSSLFSQGMYYTKFKGNLYIFPMKNMRLSFSYGKISATGLLNQIIYEASASYKPLDFLTTSVSYQHTDGVFLLYSSDLINRRIPANNLRFDANLEYKTGFMVKSYYSLIWTDKNIYGNSNIGNFFQIRVGKRFKSNSAFGYEYHFEDFKYNSNLYYTPQEFESHSIWGEWQVYKTRLWDFKIGGKLGYVPKSNFILRELTSEVSYKIYDNLRVLLSGYLGSSVREFTAYSSGAFFVNLFWSVY